MPTIAIPIDMSAWRRLAEALGIRVEANWDAAAKRRNMQRYGTQDRRAQLGPTPYFKPNGMGSAQRPSMMAQQAPDMTPRKGGLQIPAGTDRPGQGNPLMAPPRRNQQASPPPASPLSTAPNSPQGIQQRQGTQDDHQMGDQDWLDMLYGDDED